MSKARNAEAGKAERPIVDVRLGDLAPDARNARDHSAASVAAVRASLERFGQVSPIVIWRGTVKAGHARLLAARELKLETLRAVDVSDMTEAEADAFAIADNRTAELSKWNARALGDVVRRLSGSPGTEHAGKPAPLLLATGFSGAKLRPFLTAGTSEPEPRGKRRARAALVAAQAGEPGSLVLKLTGEHAATVRRAIAAAQAHAGAGAFGGGQVSEAAALSLIASAFLARSEPAEQASGAGAS